MTEWYVYALRDVSLSALQDHSQRRSKESIADARRLDTIHTVPSSHRYSVLYCRNASIRGPDASVIIITIIICGRPLAQWITLKPASQLKGSSRQAGDCVPCPLPLTDRCLPARRLPAGCSRCSVFTSVHKTIKGSKAGMLGKLAAYRFASSTLCSAINLPLGRRKIQDDVTSTS